MAVRNRNTVPDYLGRNNYFINELGCAMVFPNVRGSAGYGKTFLKLDNGFKREDSYKDISALLDWIKTRPELDPERVMADRRLLRRIHDAGGRVELRESHSLRA